MQNMMRLFNHRKYDYNILMYEFDLAIKAFNVAKKRYFSFEGELIDLREAFRNLARVETEIQETRTRLLQASGSKALLNGSTV